MKNSLVSKNFSCSVCCLLKALTTLTPVRLSLDILFISSRPACCLSDIGPVTFATKITPIIIRGIVANITENS